MYIDDCIEGTKKLFSSNCTDPVNIGSEEQVSINQMIECIEEIGNYKIEKKYLLDKPKGVRGRSSNNQFVKRMIGWDTRTKLKDGLRATYEWINSEIEKKLNKNKFTIKY